jgi:hypothetical protein
MRLFHASSRVRKETIVYPVLRSRRCCAGNAGVGSGQGADTRWRLGKRCDPSQMTRGSGHEAGQTRNKNEILLDKERLKIC